MPKVIELPALSSDFESGVIESWVKEVGETIAPGDIIAEVSTDKAVVDLEADAAGTLGKILVPAGPNEVAVNTPIAILLLDGESEDALEGFNIEAQAGASGAAPPQATPAVSQPTPERAAPVETSSGRLRSSPSARRLARELGVELDSIEGSGPRGRIVRGDVIVVSQSGPSPSPPTDLRATDSRIENDRVRRVIATKLSAAKQEIPHFYLDVDFRVDNLMAMRRRLNNVADDSYRLTVNDMIVKAVARAMHDCPEMNRSWNDEATIQYGSVDVSIAVDSPVGLVTPVLRSADNKRLSDLSNECQTLIEKARDGKLKPDDYKGGGITVSNLGMFGIRSFAAIINPPQASILAVGAARKTPVIDNDLPGVATVMSCTLSVDHRVVDGATAARFLQVLGSYLEEPERLLKDSI